MSYFSNDAAQLGPHPAWAHFRDHERLPGHRRTAPTVALRVLVRGFLDLRRFIDVGSDLGVWLPLLSDGDPRLPVVRGPSAAQSRACGGHGRGARRSSVPAGDGRQLGRWVRPVLGDHEPRWQGSVGVAAALRQRRRRGPRRRARPLVRGCCCCAGLLNRRCSCRDSQPSPVWSGSPATMPWRSMTAPLCDRAYDAPRASLARARRVHGRLRQLNPLQDVSSAWGRDRNLRLFFLAAVDTPLVGDPGRAPFPAPLVTQVQPAPKAHRTHLLPS